MNGLLLVAADTVSVQLAITGNACYAAATSNELKLKVTKGKPVIDWVPTTAVVVGQPVGALSAPIEPAILAPDLKYSLKPTDVWPNKAFCHIRVDFPGSDHFLPFGMEAKQVVVRSAGESRGASEMLNGTGWQRPGANTAKGQALQLWNADQGGVKALGQKIAKGIANKTYGEVCSYLDSLTPDETGKSNGQDMYRWDNGLQVRVKQEGSDHAFGTEVNVEMVTNPGSFTTHVAQTAFKVMINGNPGAAHPGDIRYPGNLAGGPAGREAYKAGAMRVDHLRCPKVPQLITWKLWQDNPRPKLKFGEVRTDLMTVSCLGGAALTVKINGTQRSLEDFAKFNFPGKIDFNLHVEAAATERYTGATASCRVTPE